MATLPSFRAAKSTRVRTITPQITAMLSVLESLPVHKSWTVDVKSQYRTMLRNVKRRAAYQERLHARMGARFTALRWRLDQGARLAHTKDLDAQLTWLLNRGRVNVHAAALGKIAARKLGREHYSRIGKLGAQRRWHLEQK